MSHTDKTDPVDVRIRHARTLDRWNMRWTNDECCLGDVKLLKRQQHKRERRAWKQSIAKQGRVFRDRAIGYRALWSD